jgi:hypothetical protein
MKIAPDIAARQWEQATLEQLTADMQRQGYSVERAVPLGHRTADLIARRDEEVILFEVKVPGASDPADWAPSVVGMQAEAKKLGAKFQLVVARLPKQTTIRIEGLETALERFLADNMPDQLLRLSNRVMILEVDGIEYSSITYEDGFQVTGEGDISLSLPEKGGDTIFPFSFRGDFQVRPDDPESPLLVRKLMEFSVDAPELV